MPPKPPLTGKEVFFDKDEVIVSKTDKTGRIIYANDVFLRVAQYEEDELIGEQHSIIRHPGMPRAVFKLLWDTILAGSEIFAYVVNRTKPGDHYWVFAHVTPNYDNQGQIDGFHSSRRVPRRDAVGKITPIYNSLLDIENKAGDRKTGLAQSFKAMTDLLEQNRISYEEFVYGL